MFILRKNTITTNPLVFIHFLFIIIFCGCQKQKDNPKSNSDLEIQILMLSNRVLLTEKILRYAILKDTSTNVYEKLLSGEYNPKNVLDDKNLELLRGKIDILYADDETAKYPEIQIENKNLYYPVRTGVGDFVIIVEDVINKDGSVYFSTRVINTTSIEIISANLVLECNTKEKKEYRIKSEVHKFNNLKSGEGILLNIRLNDLNIDEISSTKMAIGIIDFRYKVK